MNSLLSGLSSGMACSCSVSQGGYTSSGSDQFHQICLIWAHVQELLTMTTRANAPARPYASANSW
jgi:hypothetical protein